MPKIVASKEDWIKLGFQLFSESGEKGIVIDKMSKTLKCNKSSFYWHFKTRADFIKQLFKFWEEKYTYEIIEEVNREDSPKSKLLKLIEIAFKKDSNLDFIFFLKKYSLADETLKNTIDNIDKERIEYVAFLLESDGYSPEVSKLKSKILYKYLIGYHEMIRYKEQTDGWLEEVLTEINEFIKIT